MNFPQSAKAPLLKALKCWLIGMSIGIGGYGSYEIGAIYWKSYQLESATRKVARLAATNIRSGPAIHDDIYRKAQQLRPVREENIVVSTAVSEVPAASISSLMEASPRMNTVGMVAIEVSYAVPVRFPGYTLQVKIHFHADDRSI